jgi:hypothetical protein
MQYKTVIKYLDFAAQKDSSYSYFSMTKLQYPPIVELSIRILENEHIVRLFWLKIFLGMHF